MKERRSKIDRRAPKEPEVQEDRPGHKRAWVSYIATFLGVGMTIVGLLLVLWGLAWQTGVGEANQINSDDTFGGPGILPFGVVTFAVGLMWIIHGWNRFKRARGKEMMKTCQNCGKRVEEDLNFCYYCNTRFQTDDEGSKRARPLDDTKS